MPVMESLSLQQARRIALGAQGLARPRPSGRVDRRHVRRVLGHVACIQIDSVNVLVRAQEMPLFARLGPHARDVLPRMTADAQLFEYWGHMASLIPIEHYPLFGWRMARARAGEGTWRHLSRFAEASPEYIEATFRAVAERGPVTAADLDPDRNRNGPWWGWHDAKLALEYLLWGGRLAARRTGNFERVYDLPERMLPRSVLDRPALPEADAQRELLHIAAGALGVATLADLADYWRIKGSSARPLVKELVDDGRLVPVDVEGWEQVAYVPAGVRVPRRVGASTLLSPFDPVVWERRRLERLFGFHYRIEIYVPQPKRVWGYYVLPFLHRERFVARVDLRSDRKRGLLEVRAAYAEPGLDPDGIAALASELRVLGEWLALAGVEVTERGDLAGPLRDALAS